MKLWFNRHDTPTNREKNKYTLGGAISMLVGSVIGIGIFFKNGSVLANSGSGVIAIIGWLIGGMIVFATAYCFVEMFSSKKQTNKGLAKAAEVYGHYWLSKTFTWFFKVITFPILLLVLAYYIAWFFWPIFNVDPATVHPAAHYALTMAILAWFCFFNSKWIKGGENYQKIITIIKLIPFLILVLVAFPSKQMMSNNFTNVFVTASNGEALGIWGNGFLGLMLALPPILFAYDGFQDVVNIKDELKNSKKNLKWAILIGILTVILVYTLVALTIFTYAKDGSVLTFADKAFSQWFTKVVQIIIFISATGGLNKFSIVFSRFSRENAKNNEHFFSSFVAKSSKKNNAPIGAMMWHFHVTTAFFSFIIIIACFQVLGGEKFSNVTISKLIDIISNWNSVFTFILTSLLLLVGVFRRWKDKKMADIQHKMRLFTPFAIFATITTLAIGLFSFGHTIYLAATVTENSNNLILVIVFCIFLILIISGPFVINSIRSYYYLSQNKKTFKNIFKAMKIGLQSFSEKKLIRIIGTKESYL